MQFNINTFKSADSKEHQNLSTQTVFCSEKIWFSNQIMKELVYAVCMCKETLTYGPNTNLKIIFFSEKQTALSLSIHLCESLRQCCIMC